MTFCSIDRLDADTIAMLLNVYADTMEETIEKDYVEKFDNAADARAAQIRDFTALLEAFVAQDDRYVFALRDGETIACALRVIPMNADNWYLEALGTAPEYRAQGCAKRLLKETLRCMRVTSAKSIVSVVRRDNMASRAVHEACGFADAGKTAKDGGGTAIEECIVYRYVYQK